MPCNNASHLHDNSQPNDRNLRLKTELHQKEKFAENKSIQSKISIADINSLSVLNCKFRSFSFKRK